MEKKTKDPFCLFADVQSTIQKSEEEEEEFPLTEMEGGERRRRKGHGPSSHAGRACSLPLFST